MTRRTFALLTWVIAVTLVAAGCGIRVPDSGEELPIGPVILFEEDFSEQELDALPAGWSRQGSNVTVVVVNDPRDASNRVVKVEASAGEEENERNVGFYAPRWAEAAEQARIVAIEFDILVGQGLANLYVNTPTSSTTLQLSVNAERQLRSWSGNALVGDLGDRWNRVRIVANHETDQMDIYLNDMETPALTNSNFRAKVDSWKDARLWFSHNVKPGDRIEFYYDNFKVWVVD